MVRNFDTKKFCNTDCDTAIYGHQLLCYLFTVISDYIIYLRSSVIILFIYGHQWLCYLFTVIDYVSLFTVIIDYVFFYLLSSVIVIYLRSS